MTEEVISRAAAIMAVQTAIDNMRRGDKEGGWPAFVVEALRALPAVQPQGQRVQHIKRGSTYRVIGRGNVQTAKPLTDFDEVVIYQSEDDGRIWVRRAIEFNEGRFTLLPALKGIAK